MHERRGRDVRAARRARDFASTAARIPPALRAYDPGHAMETRRFAAGLAGGRLAAARFARPADVEVDDTYAGREVRRRIDGRFEEA